MDHIKEAGHYFSFVGAYPYIGYSMNSIHVPDVHKKSFQLPDLIGL
jgi:hypothetical protein